MRRNNPLRSNWKLWPAAIVLLLGCICVVPLARGRAEDKADAAAEKTAHLPRPIVDSHHLMKLFHEPLHRDLKAAMRREPTSDRAWEYIHDRGQRAAEIANLTAIREDAAEHEQWKALSADAQKSAIALADAAESRDYVKAKAAYAALIRNCNDCHQATVPELVPMLEP